jgi:hypothetical protein
VRETGNFKHYPLPLASRERPRLSVSPFSLAKRPQTDEPDLPLHLRLNGLSREPNLPANPRPVAHAKLAKAVELQRESIRAQMIEQGCLQAPNHRVDDVLSLFLRRQRQSSLNPLGQLISTSYARSHVVQIPFRRRVSMLSNTAEIENQPVHFPNFAVEKRTYKPDPFTIKGGRYVGSDGFVVPKDFEEFYQRYPDYVRNWVNKYGDRSARREELEDWTQDLLIHLYHLPQTSKHREAGKQDIVETLDPMKHYGASEARFRNYINLCLTNKFRTMRSKRMKDALHRPGNLSLDGQTEGQNTCSVNDEYCHSHSTYLRTAAKASEKQSSDGSFLQEFADFVQREDPKVLSAIESLVATGTQGAAADWLGITQSEFGRTRNRLSQLAECFLSGDPVSKQRRPYKKRSRKTSQPSRSHHNWTRQVRRLA